MKQVKHGAEQKGLGDKLGLYLVSAALECFRHHGFLAKDYSATSDYAHVSQI